MIIKFVSSALEALEQTNVDIIDLVERHIARDWGDLSDDDKRLNDKALHDGSRILSAYILPTDVKIWIIGNTTFVARIFIKLDARTRRE